MAEEDGTSQGDNSSWACNGRDIHSVSYWLQARNCRHSRPSGNDFFSMTSHFGLHTSLISSVSDEVPLRLSCFADCWSLEWGGCRLYECACNNFSCFLSLCVLAHAHEGRSVADCRSRTRSARPRPQTLAGGESPTCHCRSPFQPAQELGRSV